MGIDVNDGLIRAADAITGAMERVPNGKAVGRMTGIVRGNAAKLASIVNAADKTVESLINLGGSDGAMTRNGSLWYSKMATVPAVGTAPVIDWTNEDADLGNLFDPATDIFTAVETIDISVNSQITVKFFEGDGTTPKDYTQLTMQIVLGAIAPVITGPDDIMMFGPYTTYGSTTSGSASIALNQNLTLPAGWILLVSFFPLLNSGDHINARMIQDGTADLSSGHDWSCTNETFTVNVDGGGEKTITLSANCANINDVNSHIVSQLTAAGIYGPNALQLQKGPLNLDLLAGYTGTVQQVVVGDGSPNNALTTLGWTAGTYNYPKAKLDGDITKTYLRVTDIPA